MTLDPFNHEEVNAKASHAEKGNPPNWLLITAHIVSREGGHRGSPPFSRSSNPRSGYRNDWRRDYRRGSINSRGRAGFKIGQAAPSPSTSHWAGPSSTKEQRDITVKRLPRACYRKFSFLIISTHVCTANSSSFPPYIALAQRGNSSIYRSKRGRALKISHKSILKRGGARQEGARTLRR